MTTTIVPSIRVGMITRYEDLDTIFEHTHHAPDRLAAAEGMCELRKALGMSHDQILKAAALKNYA